MKQTRHDLATAIAQRSLAASPAADLPLDIAAYLLDEHRTAEFESLMRDVMQIRADEGIVEVVAHSGFALSQEVILDIETEVRRAYPQAKRIIVSHKHDPSVVAGVTLVFANQQLDLSVKGKLRKFKQLTRVGKER